MAAGNAIIGALRAVLGVDTAAFETGLKSATRQLSSFGGGVAKINAAVAASFVVVGTAVAVAVKKAIDQAEELNKVSQKIGVPIEELSALKHAAELSEVSFESLQNGFVRLSKTMVEAVSKPTSDASNAFRALGISSKFLADNMNNPTAVMLELANRFEGLNEGAGKTGAALKIFGKAGADMLPFLNEGKEGITALMEEAKKFGIVIDKETGKSADAFNDNMLRLQKIVSGAVLQFTAGLLPTLEKVSESFIRVGNSGDGFKAWGETVGSIITSLVNVAERLSLEFNQLGATFSALWNVVKVAAGGLENPRKAWAEYQTVIAKNKVELQNLTARQNDATVAIGTSGGVMEKVTKNKTDFNTATAAGKNALDQFFESQTKSIASQQAELQTIGLASGAKERLRVVLQGLAVAQAAQIPITEALRKKLMEAGDAAGNMALKIQGAQLIQSALAPNEAFRQEINNNILALQAQGATAEQIAVVMEKTAEKYGNTWGQVGDSVAGSFKEIGNAFAKESKGMAFVAKAAGIAQATISMFVGAAKALELPFPANIAAWAKVLALGASAIAGIKGTNAGFATGGMMRVPGGMGGGDKVSTMLSLEPGEQLDIWRPEQLGDPRRRAGGGEVTIRVDGAWRPFVEQLIPQINSALRDGHQLKLSPA